MKTDFVLILWFTTSPCFVFNLISYTFVIYLCIKIWHIINAKNKGRIKLSPADSLSVFIFLIFRSDYTNPFWRNEIPSVFRQCWKLFISYILWLYEKRFIPARQDSSFVLPRSCFTGTKFSHVIALAHLSGMKSNLKHAYERKLKENVSKSKQILGEKLPCFPSMNLISRCNRTVKSVRAEWDEISSWQTWIM